MEETTQEIVYRMYIKEGRYPAEITTALQGRVRPVTVRDYIHMAIKQAKERGDSVPQRTAPRKGGFPALQDRKPISQMHLLIGNRLSRYRETTEGMRPQAFVDSHGHFVSAVVLRHMEQGVHDFTLTELRTVAGILQTDVLKLMEPAPDRKC